MIMSFHVLCKVSVIKFPDEIEIADPFTPTEIIIIQRAQNKIQSYLYLRFRDGCIHRLKAGVHIRSEHKHKHKPCVNRDDASTTNASTTNASTRKRSVFLFLVLASSQFPRGLQYDCACACLRVSQPQELPNNSTFFIFQYAALQLANLLWRFHTIAAPWKDFYTGASSPPIVLSWYSWNWPLTNLKTKLDFPTADSPERKPKFNWWLLCN